MSIPSRCVAVARWSACAPKTPTRRPWSRSSTVMARSIRWRVARSTARRAGRPSIRRRPPTSRARPRSSACAALALPDPPRTNKEKQMDKEHVKGAADKAKGAIKETAGKMTGDKKLETEGKVDKVKGAVHKAVGDAKDALKK